jgi:sugar lactone lactonase YvrE
VVDARAALGEGPSWDARRGALLWVDIDGGRVHTFDPRTGAGHVRSLGEPVGFAIPRASGGLAIGMGSAFALLDDGATEPQIVADLPGNGTATRMNDGRCDSAGRLWAGTMGLDAEPGAGTLYRLDPDHRVHTMLEGVTISNGIDWSPDDRRMYYVDSATGRIDVFEFDAATGRIANPRPFVQIPEDDGEPDGLTVDADGHVWVAVWAASAVRRYAPDGTLVGELRLPVSLVTSCTFGGDDLRDLYVTTARYALTPQQLEAQPQAGGVFRARPGVRGRPATPFAG